jgi:hypothetical protein
MTSNFEIKIYTVIIIFNYSAILAEFHPKPAQLDFDQKLAELSAQKWSNFAWNG